MALRAVGLVSGVIDMDVRSESGAQVLWRSSDR